MPNEQDKAIERCNNLIRKEHSSWIGISNQKAIEKLLNMLKEKDEELKMYKDIKEIANYKVTDLAKLKKLNEMQKEIEKKDKMIDYLLRAYLYSIASGEKFTLEINNKKYKDTEIDNRIEQLRKFVENNILKE